MNVQELNEKKIYTANQMTGELLLGIVLYGILSYVVYRIIYALAVNFIEDDNFILLSIIVLVLHTLMVTVTFKLANRQAFKKGTIYKSDVSNVVKNVSFVIIVTLLIQVFGNLANISSTVDEAVQDDSSLKYQEYLMSAVYNEYEMEIYRKEKERSIQEIKNKLYQYITIIDVGIIVIYGSAIFFEKKSLYKKAQ